MACTERADVGYHFYDGFCHDIQSILCQHLIPQARCYLFPAATLAHQAPAAVDWEVHPGATFGLSPAYSLHRCSSCGFVALLIIYNNDGSATHWRAIWKTMDTVPERMFTLLGNVLDLCVVTVDYQFNQSRGNVQYQYKFHAMPCSAHAVLP